MLAVGQTWAVVEAWCPRTQLNLLSEDWPLTCFWPGAGEDSEGQEHEATQRSELSHLHPDDTDLADLAGSGTGSDSGGADQEESYLW